MKNNELSIIYSSDNNYCVYMSTSIISLLENNKEFKYINIYVIDNKISDENKDKLEMIVRLYQRNIIFINFEKYKSYLNLNMLWNISISAYAR